MSETSNVTVLPEAPVSTVPFYKNPRILKTAGIVAASAAAGAFLYVKFTQSATDDDETSEDVNVDA
jgi:hypothetical protein